MKFTTYQLLSLVDFQFFTFLLNSLTLFPHNYDAKWLLLSEQSLTSYLIRKCRLFNLDSFDRVTEGTG